MSKRGAKIAADLVRQIQQTTGMITKSPEVGDLIRAAVAEAECLGALRECKRRGGTLRELTKAVRALSGETSGKPHMPATVMVPMSAGDYISELRRVTTAAPVNGNAVPYMQTWSGNGQAQD